MLRWKSGISRHRFFALSLAFAVGLGCSGSGASAGEDTGPEATPVEDARMHGAQALEDGSLVDEVLGLSTDDLPDIAERGVLRVLVNYSPTTYYVAKGAHHGFEAEMMRAFVKHLTEHMGKERMPVRATFVPLPFDRLIGALEEGRGDVIAAGMTITPARQERIAFASPYLPDVSEVVVTRTGTPATTATELAGLAGSVAHVVRGSSYVESLASLNADLEGRGLAPVQVVEVNEEIEASDLLELLNLGVLEWTVVDRHIAEAWASGLPELVVRDDLVVRAEADLAWAVRKNNPELLAALESFVSKHRKGTLMGNMMFKRYFEGDTPASNPLSDEERAELEVLASHFQKRADEHGFDWLLLAAQAYRESRFNQNLKSHAGAVGVMQIKPSTAGDVGVDDISTAEANIQAGVAYLAYLRDRYFSDDEIPPDVQAHFALAAYNMGPAKMRKMRAKAEAQGLDPNVWFGNVEYATRGVVGREPVDYVADIQRYYIAYKLVLRAREARTQAIDSL